MLTTLDILRTYGSLIAWVGMAYIGALFGIMLAGFTCSHIIAVTLRHDESEPH